MRGKRDAPRMGRLLRDEDLLPDLILTSTAKRTCQTVEAFVAASGYTGKVKENRALYLATSQDYIDVLRALPDKYERVMAVGHNPEVEELAIQLTGQATRMPTAALARIDLPLNRWEDLGEKTEGELRGVWRPKELT